jgi:hypothetical protein
MNGEVVGSSMKLMKETGVRSAILRFFLSPAWTLRMSAAAMTPLGSNSRQPESPPMPKLRQGSYITKISQNRRRDTGFYVLK